MGHFIKGAIRTSAPSRLAAIAIDRITDGDQCVLGRWHLRYSRRRGDRYGYDHQSWTGDNPDRLCERLIKLSLNGSRLYCVVEDGADGLTLAGFWDWIESGRMSIRPHGATASNIIDPSQDRKKRYLPMCMTSAADVIGVNHQSGSIRFIHPKNHSFGISREQTPHTLYPDDMEQIGKYLGDKWHDWPMEARSLALLRYYQHLQRWWILGNCGTWQDTIGAMGLSWWKRHVPKRSVLIHDCESAHAAECSACYGGRQQVFYFGRQLDQAGKREYGKIIPPTQYAPVMQETLFDVDFRSMYASIMLNEKFPVKLLDTVQRKTPDQIYHLTDDLCILATCRIKTDTNWHPYRRSRGVCYPTGEWVTTLTTPEYRYAYERGEIITVDQAFTYQQGRPLKEFAERALGLRRIADLCRDGFATMLFKSVANALTGKFAARKCRWIDAPKVRACVQWGEFGYSPSPPGKPTRARAIGGRVQVMDRTDTRTPGLTAIYAHITAYGRLLSQRVLSAAGHRQCVYWDTDGGLFTQTGLDRLKASGIRFGTEPGDMRVCGEVHASIHKAPKRHFRDGKYTLSGIPAGFTVNRAGKVEYTHDLNPARQGIDPNEAGVKYQTSSMEFSSIASGVPVLSSGWAMPLIASGDSLFTSEEIASASPARSPTLFD